MLPEKIVLADKGQQVDLPTVKKLVATLSWKNGNDGKEVDLDLMAFFEPKDGGEAGGVFTNLLPGGDLGDLNKFPFIKLSGDAGVGGAAGEHQEELKITNLDKIGKLHLIAVNYTESQKNTTNSPASFSEYNGHIEVKDDTGHSFDIPLKSTTPGTVAHVLTIDNTGGIGAVLEMKDEVMQFNQFVEAIPGAKLIGKQR